MLGPAHVLHHQQRQRLIIINRKAGVAVLWTQTHVLLAVTVMEQLRIPCCIHAKIRTCRSNGLLLVLGSEIQNTLEYAGGMPYRRDFPVTTGSWSVQAQHGMILPVIVFSAWLHCWPIPGADISSGCTKWLRRMSMGWWYRMLCRRWKRFPWVGRMVNTTVCMSRDVIVIV